MVEERDDSMPEPPTSPVAGEFQRIRFETRGPLAVVTLNRPERRNALDSLTVAELHRAIARADEDAAVVALLLRGEGPDFCAGADLEQLRALAESDDPEANLADAMALGGLFIAMRGARVPIVAAVQGNALAGGAGLATAADMIVASDNATFGYPEIRLGFVPAMVTALLRRAVGEKKAFELIARGGRFDAKEAQRLGLVAQVWEAERFTEASLDFARDLAGRSATALELCKRLLYGIDAMTFEQAVRRGAEINVEARLTPDFRAGVQRFLERRSR